MDAILSTMPNQAAVPEYRRAYAIFELAKNKLGSVIDEVKELLEAGQPVGQELASRYQEAHLMYTEAWSQSHDAYHLVSDTVHNNDEH